MDLYRHSATTCVASYVRGAVQSPERRAEIREKLKKGLPDVERGYGVTAIFDLCGYSKLTSELTNIGKMASEVITKTVSDYLDEVILVISRFRGDVVKFLGDAILVCFPKRERESEEETMHRAYLCCLYISTQLCSLTIDLELAMQESNRLGNNTSQFISSSQQPSTQNLSESKAVTLPIHVALTASEIFHVIIGDPDVRMDYSINGSSLHQLGDILDATKPGELGLSNEVFEKAVMNVPSTNSSNDGFRKQEGAIILEEKRLKQLYYESESMITQIFAGNDDDQLDDETPIAEEAFSMLELFVNQALLRKLRYGQEVRKEINSPLSKGSQYSTVAVKSEFRVVSILFVKLLSPFSPEKAQVAMSSFVAILKQYEGSFQQFSVDDKPWTHEKDPLNAIKAALDFEDFCHQNRSVGNVSISVATGELLFSLLGSGERKEASLLGDVVNLAARLISLPVTNAVVKVDKFTYDVTKQDVTPTSLGLFKVKGKVEPVEVWTVAKKKIVAESSADMFGYISEKEFIKSAVSQWSDAGVTQKIVFEGPSGVGKSSLLNYLCREVSSLGMSFCLIQGTEIKQYTPYSATQPLLSFIFQLYIRLASVDSSFLSNAASIAKFAKPSSINIAKRGSVSTFQQYASNNQSIMTLQNPTHSRVAESFLSFMGQDPKNTGLLSDLLPILNLTAQTENSMDAQTRSFLIKKMVVRMVETSISMEKFVIVLDDSQWLDAISLEIIFEIAKACPQIMIVFFTRPISDIQVPIMKNICQLPQVDHIILNGLGPRDIESLLKQKLGVPEIKSISEQICQVVLEKSNKLPLYIDLIAESLKTQLYDIFAIESNGQLIFKGCDGENRIAALSTISSSVLTQFDRLDPAFQSLLLKASILGQYFILEDLCYFLPGKSQSVEDLQRLIEQHDTYHYLIKQEQDESGEHPWFFRHIQIMQALYNSQSFAERSATHLQAAEYYEASLELSTNRDFILPIVAYHYRKTSDIQKQITYLEELGIQNYRKSHSTSMTYLEALLEIVSQNEHSLKVDPMQRAHWLAILAVQKVNVAVYTAEQYERAVLALRLVGAPWPEDPSQVGKSLIKCAIALYKLWKATKGGTRPLPETTDCFGQKKEISYYKVPPNDNVAETMIQAYRTLFRLGLFSNLLDSKTKLLVMLSQVSVNMISGYKSKGTWAGMLYFSTFGLSWAVVPVSRAYWKQAEKIESMITDDQDREQLDGYYQYKGYNLVQAARLKDASEAIERSFKHSSARGDLTNQIIINCFQMLICLLQGDITSHEDRATTFSREKSTFQLVNLYYLTLRKVVTVDFAGAQARHQRARDVMKSFPPNPTVDRILDTNETWLLLQQGKVSQAIDFFYAACIGLSELRHVFAELHSVVFSVGILSWMLARPSVPDHSTGLQGLTEQDRARVLSAVEAILKTTSFFAVKNKMRLYWVAHIILQGSRLFLLKKKKKAMGFLLKEFKAPRCTTILKDLKVPKAFLLSILGVHLQNEADRQHYYRQALQMYQDFGFSYMEKWIVWNNQQLARG
ncbi:hypothetical protein HDV05_006145 [Chytridiales sp. JEL 0842]|nr:hypothetical protein HDV05_006145 [Chytridiales sp. JEL 0842]